MKTRSILWISLLLIGFTGCQEDEPANKIYSINGLVQKGPYVNGTTIALSELESLDQTGNTYVVDNTGRFVTVLIRSLALRIIHQVLLIQGGLEGKILLGLTNEIFLI